MSASLVQTIYRNEVFSRFPEFYETNVHSRDNNRLKWCLSWAILFQSMLSNSISSKYAFRYLPIYDKFFQMLSFLYFLQSNPLHMFPVLHTCYMHGTLHPRTFGRFYIHYSTAVYIQRTALSDAYAANRPQLWRFILCRIKLELT